MEIYLRKINHWTVEVRSKTQIFNGPHKFPDFDRAILYIESQSVGSDLAIFEPDEFENVARGQDDQYCIATPWQAAFDASLVISEFEPIKSESVYIIPMDQLVTTYSMRGAGDIAEVAQE